MQPEPPVDDDFVAFLETTPPSDHPATLVRFYQGNWWDIDPDTGGLPDPTQAGAVLPPLFTRATMEGFMKFHWLQLRPPSSDSIPPKQWYTWGRGTYMARSHADATDADAMSRCGRCFAYKMVNSTLYERFLALRHRVSASTSLQHARYGMSHNRAANRFSLYQASAARLPRDPGEIVDTGLVLEDSPPSSIACESTSGSTSHSAEDPGLARGDEDLRQGRMDFEDGAQQASPEDEGPLQPPNISADLDRSSINSGDSSSIDPINYETLGDASDPMTESVAEHSDVSSQPRWTPWNGESTLSLAEAFAVFHLDMPGINILDERTGYILKLPRGGLPDTMSHPSPPPSPSLNPISKATHAMKKLHRVPSLSH